MDDRGVGVIDLQSDEEDVQSGGSYDTEEERKRKNAANGSPKNKRKRIYQRGKYRKEWEKDLDWLTADKDHSKGKCKYCKCSMRAKLADLKDHGKTEKHKKSVEEERKLSASTSSIDSFVKPPISDEQKTAELKIAAFIAESSIAFRQADPLIDLIKAVVKKDSISKKIKLGRTKCTKLVIRVLSPGFRKIVLDDLGNGKYSLLIDESTDVATLPMLCLVLRYVSLKEHKMVTTFYRLIRLEGKNSECITNAILDALKEDSLDIKNLVGLGTDGAPVLIGDHNGVIARLREHQEELLLVPCVCHSLHNAAKYAFAKLPCHLESLVRDVYGYFRQSSSRKDRYTMLYNEMNGVLPLKLLKLHDVRWLSRFQCIDALLKQWDELVLFFEGESQNGAFEQRYTARLIFEMLSDSKNKVYLCFCRWFLKPFMEKNLLFQTENGDALRLINEFDLFYVSLLGKFVTLRQLDNFRRSNVDLMEFDFERYLCHLNMVHFGIEFQENISGLTNIQDRDVIKDRCRSCLVEAAREVRKRLRKSLNTLRLLESLSPASIVSGKAANIVPLLQRFRTLTPDLESANDEFLSLPLFYKSIADYPDAIDFWLDVYNNKDAADNGRFSNISQFALNLFCMPFSNASVERVFSTMALVKNNLRNRLTCETVEALLAVRYGLKFVGVTAVNFNAPKEMLKLFTSDIYDKKGENEDHLFDDVYEALDASDNM